ncbi:MAG: hypothetical protein KF774_20135 [Planctomyces sp.]|nr:hypothetical protein [Planctomyces sp.]
MSTILRSAGSRILSADAVRVARDRLPLSGETEVCEGGVQVTAREQEGVVREIIVACACGKITVLECDYDVPSAAQAR